MAVEIYRNENLMQINIYQSSKREVDALVTLLRNKWAYLREKGWAGDYPVVLMRGDDTASEVFRWQSESARIEAERDSEFWNLEKCIAALSRGGVSKHTNTEALRGFHSNFPETGGVELLRGVCSCVLDIDGVIEGFLLEAINGIVLMHRSPRADFDDDGKFEMYLKILYHGAKQPIAGLGDIRIEQNFSVPNDGILKSHGEGSDDFPATAIWRVAWKFYTSRGVLVSDPGKLLVFGPGKVTHYPPIGSVFHSPTGPVDLLHEESGKKVGTLTPKELTAFDLIVTRDDEEPDPILNKPPPEIFELFERYSRP